MPKPLDQVLKEAVEHREDNFKRQFPDLNKDYQIELLKAEAQRLQNENDSYEEAITKVEKLQELEEFDPGWISNTSEYGLLIIDTVGILGLIGVAGAAAFASPVIVTAGSIAGAAHFLSEHWTNGDSIISELKSKIKENKKIKPKILLALQELSGVEGGGFKPKTSEEIMPWKKDKKTQTSSDKTAIKRQEDKQRRREKRKRKIEIGSDPSKFIGGNVNVDIPYAQQGRDDTFTSYSRPSLSNITTSGPDAELKKIESVSKTLPQSEPKGTQSSPAKIQSPQAQPKTKETTKTPTSTTEAQPKPKEEPIGKALPMPDYSNPNWTFDNRNDSPSPEPSKPSVETPSSSSPSSSPIENVQPKTSTISPKEQTPKVEEKEIVITYDIPAVQAKIEQIAKETDQQVEERAKQEYKGTNPRQQDVALKKAKFNREIAQKYVQSKNSEERENLERFFAQKFGMAKFEKGGKPTSPPPAATEAKPSEATPKATGPETPSSATASKSSAKQTRPVEAEPKKEKGYDVLKVQAYIESLAKQTDEEIEAKVKEQTKDKNPRLQDAKIHQAEFNRENAQAYLETKDPEEKAKFEDYFAIQMGLMKGNASIENKNGKRTVEVTPTSSESQKQVPPGITSSQTNIESPAISTPIEPKTTTPVTSGLSKETADLTASSKRSNLELDAVRESMVEDKMTSQQQQPIVVPVAIPSGKTPSSSSAGGSGAPSDSFIPMIIVNDEDIIRMNSYDAYKLRMI